MKKVRESNFELMRIISMIFIVLWHIIGRGLVIESSGNPAIATVFKMLKYIIIVHVDSFIILMGYFQYKKKFKLSKVISIVIQTLFYSVTIFFVLYILGYFSDLNWTTLINIFIPFSSQDYWFIASYLITYIFSDYINLLIQNLNHNQFKRLIIICFIVFSLIPFLTGMRFIENDGFNFYNFIFLYIIGAYLHRYSLKNSHIFARTNIRLYRLLLIIMFFVCSTYSYFIYSFAYSNMYSGSLFNYISKVLICSQDSYASPIVIIQTICYFEFFKTLNVKSKIINFISSCVFGIYLFHENTYLRSILYKILKFDNQIFYGRVIYINILNALIIIFVSGVLIEIIRKMLTRIIIKTKLYQKISKSFYNYIKQISGW